MSVKAMAWVFSECRIGGSDRLILLAIADEANDDGFCWPGIPRLAHKAVVSERTAIRSVGALAEAGELIVKRGGAGPKDSNRYLLVMSRDRAGLLDRYEWIETEPGFAVPKGDDLSPIEGDGLSPTKGDNHGPKGDTGGAPRVTPVSPDPTTDPLVRPGASLGSAGPSAPSSLGASFGEPADRHTPLDESARDAASIVLVDERPDTRLDDVTVGQARRGLAAARAAAARAGAESEHAEAAG